MNRRALHADGRDPNHNRPIGRDEETMDQTQLRLSHIESEMVAKGLNSSEVFDCDVTILK